VSQDFNSIEASAILFTSMSAS